MFDVKFHSAEFRDSPQTSVLKRSTPCWQRKFYQWSTITWKQCKMRCT